jgi:hypothetical protein
MATQKTRTERRKWLTNNWTVLDLLGYARRKGIYYPSSPTKANLVEAIINHEYPQRKKGR